MISPPSGDNESMHAFLSRVWSQDVRPLLAGSHRAARERSARVGGTAAGLAGMLADRLLRLRGRPFTRAMTVLGASFGAMLPDLWDWNWLSRASDQHRRFVEAQSQRRAAQLPEREALALFNLPASAAREDLRRAWREQSLRWHPDRAPSPEARAEHHLRFVTLNAAYQRLERAFDEGRLPAPPDADPRTAL